MAEKPKYLIYPVFLPMRGCDRHCVYCDQSRISGSGGFDPEAALKGAEVFILRHPDKTKQIAFYGGTFTAMETSERDKIITAFKRISDNLTSFRVSTHPEYIDDAILDWCREAGIQCIELGVQDFDDAVLNQSGRGYDGETAIGACEIVREKGLDLGVQLMPGLPGAGPRSIAVNHAALKRIRPKYLRVYPLIVIRSTPLAHIFSKGGYAPLTLEAAIAQCADYSALADALGIRIIKLGLPSNLKPEDVVAGPWHPAFGELVKAELLIRSLAAEHKPGSAIKLDKNGMALLMAHGAMYLKILRNRIENCTIKPLE